MICSTLCSLLISLLPDLDLINSFSNSSSSFSSSSSSSYSYYHSLAGSLVAREDRESFHKGMVDLMYGRHPEQDKEMSFLTRVRRKAEEMVYDASHHVPEWLPLTPRLHEP